jgi:hypothetical protein
MGPCACLADGLEFDIIDLALSDQCPRGFFGTPGNALAIRTEHGGDALQRCRNCGASWHYTRACPIPADTSVDREELKARQGGCCGEPTRPG